MLGTGGDATRFEFSPDGERAVFIANQREGAGRELWSSRLDRPGPAVLLNDSLLPDLREVITFDLDPGGQHVAFSASMEPDGRQQLFTVPIAGGQAELIGEAAVDDVLISFAFSGSGAWLYYGVGSFADQTFRRAPAAGGPAAIFATGVTEATLSPDRQHFIYQSGNGNPWQTIALETGVVAQLTGRPAERVIWSPDSSRAIYWVDEGFGELYSVPAAGGVSVRLNGAESPCTGSQAFRIRVAKDSSTVIFWCGGAEYSVPIAGGPAVVVTPFTLEDVTTTHDGATVLGIRAPVNFGEGYRITSAPTAGGEPTVLADIPPGSQFLGPFVTDLQVSADDSYLFFRRGQFSNASSSFSLWGVPLAG
ncbi:MAG: hypothetical protein AAFY88_28525, partial [Acidobacteriota bacterium]